MPPEIFRLKLPAKMYGTLVAFGLSGSVKGKIIEVILPVEVKLAAVLVMLGTALTGGILGSEFSTVCAFACSAKAMAPRAKTAVTAIPRDISIAN